MDDSTYKTLSTILVASAVILLAIYLSTSIFSIAFSCLIFSLVGLIWGLVRKNRKIWIPAIILLFLTLIGTTIFFILLSMSNM